ncbi:phosphopantetheine-binding protein [Micromonospora sp. DT178]|uniref:phosphopantetheine-binding protein n=1 Tax=unclassified Micromonospora TaxID=2617518 RepID=UPI000EB1C47A|nr:phosphopantetheine-binding protein [Micromonospora sp. M71_S20]RLK23174.1 aryl carrier-like protein [Micromonospora sp. M71_S20]
MADQLTAATIRADVAEMLHRRPDESFDTEDLFDCGLDSVRLMTLIERWRDAGARVSFVDLAERPTVEHWVKLLVGRDD